MTRDDELPEKPLAQQTLTELGEFFHAAEDLTYVFVARSTAPADQVDEFGPNYLCALELVSCLTRGMEYRRPLPDELNTVDDIDGLADYRLRVQRDVEARVRELRSRDNVSYILLWAIEGSGDTHLEHSPDYDCKSVRSELICLFANLICEYV